MLGGLGPWCDVRSGIELQRRGKSDHGARPFSSTLRLVMPRKYLSSCRPATASLLLRGLRGRMKMASGLLGNLRGRSMKITYRLHVIGAVLTLLLFCTSAANAELVSIDLVPGSGDQLLLHD